VPLSCVYRGARKWCHWLPCAFHVGARQRGLIAVRFGLWSTTKGAICRTFFPGAQQRESHAVSPRHRQFLFFCRTPHRDARQR
jgi:hypothetical protein